MSLQNLQLTENERVGGGKSILGNLNIAHDPILFQFQPEILPFVTHPSSLIKCVKLNQKISVDIYEVPIQLNLDNLGGSSSAKFIFVFSYVFNISEKTIINKEFKETPKITAVILHR